MHAHKADSINLFGFKPVINNMLFAVREHTFMTSTKKVAILRSLAGGVPSHSNGTYFYDVHKKKAHMISFNKLAFIANRRTYIEPTCQVNWPHTKVNGTHYLHRNPILFAINIFSKHKLTLCEVWGSL